jgi:hypothetical protein
MHANQENIARTDRDLPLSYRLTTLGRTSESSPICWWRTRKPEALNGEDIRHIRKALLMTSVSDEPDWLFAVSGDSAVAIGIAINKLKKYGMKNSITDIVISAVVCCAIEGDPAARVVILSALRRRAKIDHLCHPILMRWLTSKI